MKAYFSIFKLNFIAKLQYRAAAIAGICTQFAFGIVYVMIYIAFYESSNGTVSMTLNQTVTYLWLYQSFFALLFLWGKDKEILLGIRNGNIAYELCRPQNLYFKWYAKILAKKLANVILRFMPILIISLLLPAPYNLSLPNSFLSFLGFVVFLIMAAFLTTSITMLFHIIAFFTIDENGIMNMLMIVGDILSGGTIPIPFFPKALQIIADALPFKYIADFPFRLYSGNISISEFLPNFTMELVWIVGIILLGYYLLTIALKKVVVQGG